MSDKLWTTDRHQDDIVIRKTGGSNLKRAEMVQTPIGLEAVLVGLPDTEDQLAQVMFNGLRSVPVIQEFTLELGDYDNANVSVQTTAIHDVSNRSKKDLADMLTREVVRDDSVVAVKIDVSGNMHVARLNEGTRDDKENAELFKPQFSITYLKR